MTVPSNAGIFFTEIQCEIPFKHLTLISGRQMTIRESTIVTFLLAMTKAPSYLLLSACIRIVFICSDLVRLCQTLQRQIRCLRVPKSPSKIPPKLLSGCPIF